VVGLGLAGIADDEVAAEGRIGLAGADVGDAIEEPLPSPHRRIRRSSGLLTCWSDRSKYGTPDAQMTSISASDRSLG
jgi:hypothetical protein